MKWCGRGFVCSRRIRAFATDPLGVRSTMCFRASFLWRSYPPTLSTRIAVVLVALLQFVAPSWHICDLGLSNCCCDQTALASSGSATADATLPACCRHKARAGGKSESGQSCPHHPYTGFCLARFLESYFGSTSAAGPELVLRLRLVGIPDFRTSSPPLSLTPVPAGRGPPLA